MLTRRNVMACAAALASTTVWGQAPRTSRLLVGSAAGGSTDTVARLIADELQGSLGQTIVVDNKPGAGGRIVLTELKRSPPDGSTLVLSPIGAMVTIPHTVKNPGYDPNRDFTPLGQVSTYSYAIVAGPALPASTLKDALAWLKANPSKASFGSPGAGGGQHFAGVLLSQETGVKMEHVSYKGGAPAVLDLISGNIPLAITTHTEVMDHHRSGKLRVLAVTGKQRARQLPDVPTLSEAGLQMMPVEGWFALYGPVGMSAAETERWSSALRVVLAKPTVQEKIRAMGVEPHFSTPAELAAMQLAEYKRWEGPIKASGFVAD